MPGPQVRKAVFPAAGLGTRFLPATKSQPKEMLPLVDKPLIQYVVEEAVASGLVEIVLVTGRGKMAIEDHFDVSVELESVLAARGKAEELEQVRRISSLASIAYVRQREALGLGHAVLVAEPLVGDAPFAVFLGDDIIRADVPCMRQMLDVYAELAAGRPAGSPGSLLCIEPVPPEATSSYGIIAGEQVGERLWRVTDLVEKPRPSEAPSNLGIIGRYVLSPRVFAHIGATGRGAGGEIQITDALRRLLREEPIHAYRFEGTRYDAGNKLGFLQATVEFALARPDLGKPFREWLRGLELEG